MKLSKLELKKIVEKSSSLIDRLNNGFVPAPAGNPRLEKQLEKRIESRLTEWSKVVAEKEADIFLKRFLFNGFIIDKVRPYLGDVILPHATPLPGWTDLLNVILSRSKKFPPNDLTYLDYEKYSFLEKETPIPFEEILLPAISFAEDKLIPTLGKKIEMISQKAIIAFKRFLLSRLSEISSRVFEVEFGTFLALCQLHGVPKYPLFPGSESRTQYVNFAKKVVGNDLGEIFREYTVLAEMFAKRTIQWVNIIDEFLSRFESDRPEIEKVFKISNLGKIADVEPGLSDSHCEGRSVIIITFNSGFKLVYKPKSMGLEKEYFRLAEWINSQMREFLPFKTLKVISRDSYGWMEHIEHTPMNTHEEAVRYFKRSGMLLCLIYAFDGLDFHDENVIASKEFPVPIDLETFIHHRLNEPEEVLGFIDTAQKALSESVFRTHFLPQLYKEKDKFFDITGMGAISGEENLIEIQKWKNINTDAIRYDYEKVKPNVAKNTPQIKDQYLTPEDYIDDIIDGFSRMYHFLMSHKESLFKESPFEALFRNESRFVFRNTQLYYAIFKRAFQPDYLREGIDMSIQKDILYSPFLKMKNKHLIWPLIEDELSSLREMDIPKFTAFGDSDSIRLKSGQSLNQCFSESPFEKVKEKIDSFNLKDLERQVSLIKGSMDARAGSKAIFLETSVEDSSAIDNIPLLDTGQMIDQARSIAEELKSKALYSEEDEPSWIVLKSIPNSEQFMIDSMDYSLYAGRCGIALFLGALSRFDSKSEYREMAYSTMAIVRRRVKHAGKMDVSTIGIGGCSGFGSIIYSLVGLGNFLDDPGFYEDAKQAASLIHRDHIDKDKVFDIISGSAGLILTLLALYKVFKNNKEVLAQAVYCGEHLLKNRKKTKSGFMAWETLDNIPLLGFSHGAAGIAFSLLKLYQVTGNREFYKVAIEAIDYENSEYDSNKKNWRDFRIDSIKNNKTDNNKSSFMSAWCNGAPGIGLARIDTLDILDSETTREHIRSALQTTSSLSLQPRDHLCCGNTGRAEILLTAGIKLSSPEWIEKALLLTSKTLSRAETKGSLQVGFKYDFYSPGLFQGTTGVGYHLLRLTQKEPLPALLLLE